MYRKITRLGLGTAQFGLDYGINNKRGKIPTAEVFDILKSAHNDGIDTLDTAYDYGDSEKIIGAFINKNISKFKIVTKLPKTNIKEYEFYLKQSLINLSLKNIYGYLFHDFQSFVKYPEILDGLRKFQEKGVIKKIGFSLYYTEELSYLLNKNCRFDIIQIPYSILDQRFFPFFEKLKQKKIEIHTRSVFLQGLVFKKPEELDKQFSEIAKKIKKIQQLAKSSNISISVLCLNFAIYNKNIDRIIVGIDSKKNLEENTECFSNVSSFGKIHGILTTLKEDDSRILLPFNW